MRKRPASLNRSGDTSGSVLKCLAGAAWSLLCWLAGRRGTAGSILRRLLRVLPPGRPERFDQPRDY